MLSSECGQLMCSDTEFGPDLFTVIVFSLGKMICLELHHF